METNPVAVKEPEPWYKEGGGLKWISREGSDDNLGYEGHEQFLGPIMGACMPADGVFLDVGAHIGHWSISMAMRCAKVISVEAWPATMATLKTNARLNGIHDKFTFLPYAASDKSGWSYMVDPNNRIEGGSRRLEAKDAEGDNIKVPTIRLDELLGDVPRIDLIKMDIEGHEVHALHGLAGTIGRLKPKIMLEMHDPLYPFRGIEQDCAQFFNDMNYRYDVLFKHGTPEGVPVCEYWLATPR
jgi:FkbM family methyltransferase